MRLGWLWFGNTGLCACLCVISSAVIAPFFFCVTVQSILIKVKMHYPRAGVTDDDGVPVGDPGIDTSIYDRSYPWLVKQVMPEHTMGLLVAAMMASLMSSLASVFNSSATLFTMDIYAKWRPAANQRRLVWVGRVTVAVIAAFSVAWLPVIPLFGDQLWLIIQKPATYMAPPILCLFLWGMVSPKVNNKGMSCSCA